MNGSVQVNGRRFPIVGLAVYRGAFQITFLTLGRDLAEIANTEQAYAVFGYDDTMIAAGILPFTIDGPFKPDAVYDWTLALAINSTTSAGQMVDDIEPA